MKYRVCILVTIFAILFLGGCGKKQEIEISETEKILVREELAQTDVEVPPVSWTKSLSIISDVHVDESDQDRVFSDIIIDGISDNLSTISDLKVISSTTHSSDKTEESDADFILRSQAIEKGDRVNITLTLRDVSADSVIWAEEYDEEETSLFAVEASAATHAARAMGVAYAPRSLPRSSTSPDVVGLYLDGKRFLQGDTRIDINAAVKKFKQALIADSTYTPAYIGLAESYIKIVENQWDHSLVWLQLAQDVLINAMTVDPNVAEIHLLLGQISIYRGDYRRADQDFREALKRNSSLLEGWIGLGRVFSHFGLYRPCLEAYDRAMALDPTDERIVLARGMLLIGLGGYQAAEEEIRKALRYHPQDIHFHSFLALALYYQGDLMEAESEIQKGLASTEYGSFSHAVLAMILTKQGRLDDALGEVELEVKPYVGNDASLATAVAAIYALLNRNGEAIQWLEKALAWGYMEYLWVDTDPNFGDLRDDERFINILETMRRAWEDRVRQYHAVES